MEKKPMPRDLKIVSWIMVSIMVLVLVAAVWIFQDYALNEHPRSYCINNQVKVYVRDDSGTETPMCAEQPLTDPEVRYERIWE